MPNVQLIVTGEMEKLILHKSLERVFSEFEVNFWDPIKLDCFTSNRIRLDEPSNPPKQERIVDKLVNALFSNIETGRNGVCPDMVIVIEDLELANRDQPGVVVRYFLDAVQRKIAAIESKGNLSTSQKIKKRLKYSCSFHLFVPMTETYFFGEGQSALDRAGAQLASTVSGTEIDVEDFLVISHVYNGVDYLRSPSPKDASYWAASPSQRSRHPKRYLDFLCCPEMNLNKELRYKETKGGKMALESLDWGSICSNQSRVRYLRSLFEDIAEKFELPNLYPGSCAPLTRCTNSNVLRNM